MINKSDFINKLLIILMSMSIFFAISIRQDKGIIPVSVQGIVKITKDTNNTISKIENEKPNIEIITSQTYKTLNENSNFKHTIIKYNNENEPIKIKDKDIGQIYDIVEDSKDESENIISKRSEIINSDNEITRLKFNRAIQLMLGATFIFIYFAFLKISLDGLLQEGGFYIGQ